MKTQILILFFIFCIFDIKGQPYKPFDFDNGIWLSIYGNKSIGSIMSLYYCNGDTTVNDTLYKKMYVNEKRSPFTGSSSYFSGYFCAIKNTINKQVIYIPSGKIYSKLLYDFNLSINDSIHAYDEFGNYILVVNKIDSVQYCKKYFRRYVVDNSDHTFIEGIGFSGGLFRRYIKTSESWSFLECYRERNNSLCDICWDEYMVSLNVSNLSNGLKIYPNPVDKILNIESLKFIQKVFIVNLIGNYVFKNENINLQNFKVNIGNLKGFCIVQILFVDNTMENRKIVLE
jgi:hypothetical protein